MPATLHVTKKLTVTPLVDIQHPRFAGTYSKGLWWAMYGDNEREQPLPDSYLFDTLTRDASKGFFDGQHNDLLDHCGFYFGMVHGAILDPQSGRLSPSVNTLATLSHPESVHGYSVARRMCFYDHEPASRIDTDSELLDLLCGIAEDAQKFPHDTADNWYYSIGCILGTLSVSLFPATRQEWEQWEAEHRTFLAKMKREAAQRRNTEPLDSVPFVEYIV